MTYIDGEIARAITDATAAFGGFHKISETSGYSPTQGMYASVMILNESQAGEPVALVHSTDGFVQADLLSSEDREKVIEAQNLIGKVLGWRQ